MIAATAPRSMCPTREFRGSVDRRRRRLARRHSPEYFIAGIEPEVEAAVRTAIDKLARMGAEIVEISLPHTEYALPVYYLIAPAEASANFSSLRRGALRATP